jgi:translocation and assembly module TamB
MRRTIVIAVLALLGAVVLALLGGAGWLLGTNSGARWALALAGRAVQGGSLEVREIRGVLASPLELRGVRFVTPTLDVTVGRIEARWSFGAILLGRLEVQSLVIDSVRVAALAARDTVPAKARPAPRLQSLRAPLDVRVRHLALRGLHVSAPGDTAWLAVSEGRLSGRWHDDRVRIDTLVVRSPMFDADVRGEIVTRGPWRLDLSSEWALRPPDHPEFAGRGRTEGSVTAWRVTQHLDAPFPARFDVRGTLDPIDLSRLPRDLSARLEFERLDPHVFAPRTPPMKLDGQIEAKGEIDRFDATLVTHMRSDSLPSLDLEGSLGREGERIRVDRLVATRPGKRGSLETRGWIGGLLPAPAPSPPRGDLTVEWRDLAWPLDGEALVRSAEGRLKVRGTMRRYTLEGGAAFATKLFESGRVQLAASGDSAGLMISRLAARAPRESLVVSGSLAWRPALRWDAEVSAHGLDPATLWPDWPGHITVAARVWGVVADSNRDLEARVTALGGTLRGHPLTGGGGIMSHGDHLALDGVHVTWGDARLDVHGGRGAEWDAHAALVAPTLAVLDSLASGALNAKLDVAGAADAPRIRLVARGDSLGFHGETVGALDVTAAAGLRPEDPTELAVEARNALLSGVPLDRVALSASGTTAHHALRASASTARESLVVEIGGGLDRAHWTGALERLDYHSFHAGEWKLEGSVPVTASADSVAIAPLNLHSGDASLRAHGAWSTTHGWNGAASLTQVPLALLDPLLPNGARIVGRLEGRLEGHASGPHGPIEALAELTPESPTLLLIPATRGKADTLGLRNARLSARIDREGLDAEMQVEALREGQVSAQIRLPGFDPYAADRAAQPIIGRISASATLDVLGAFVTGIREPRGSLAAALEIRGTLGRPELAGEAHVKDGAVTVPALAVTFDEIRLDAHPREGGQLAIEGGARSKTGRVALEGSFDPRGAAGATVKLALKGKDITVADTRDSQVRVSPDLALEWAGTRATVSGTVDVPFARIQLAGLAPTAQTSSPDVVFVGAEAESTQVGLKLSARVRVVVGDDVEVRGTGYRVKPEGNLLVIDEPEEATRATGELKIDEGSYRAYGQDLVIERGRLIFGGGPIANPGLDVRAVRTADDGTVAGILVSNTLNEPVVQLFSVPAMSDANVLSYIMSGKPQDASSSSLGKSSASALGMQGGTALAQSMAGQMGLGEASVESTGGMQEASLFLGTYLSPRLYMAYGIGLFEDVHTLRLRYSVASRWSIQAESGKAQSGIIQYRGER